MKDILLNLKKRLFGSVQINPKSYFKNFVAVFKLQVATIVCIFE